MLNFLNKPYPFNNDFKHNTKIIFVISLIIFVFLILFQPFDLSSLQNTDKIYLIIGLCVVTFISLSINLLFLPAIAPKIFIYREWNIKKEIFWNIWILFTVGTGYFFYFQIIDLFKINFYVILKIIGISIVPISVIVTANQERLLKVYLKKANELTEKLTKKKSIFEEKVHFKSKYQKDHLIIKINSLLFVRSANNYIEVFWEENNSVKNQLVRSSLLTAENILAVYDFITKCHRTSIVNTNHILKIEGDSRGYKLYFKDVDFAIPVSRNYIENLNAII
ncbi:MAG: LytTR family transcriptional regulator DNA-binding domain-containing protein [Bacteroidota bacterium]|nr:LytTR family transcriptional regulator DNA-binding domain-containing protein [Bacteroidota bacterium]